MKQLFNQLLISLVAMSLISCEAGIGDVPYNLVYPETIVILNVGEDYTVGQPQIGGTEPFTFELSSQNSNVSDFVSVNSLLGVITINSNSVVGTYDIYIKVTNPAGSSDLLGLKLMIEDIAGSGIYEFGSATLVDGNINDMNTTDLFIIDGNLLISGLSEDITIHKGEVQATSAFVDSFFKGAAPCENFDQTSWTYQINLKGNNQVAFICTSENDLSEDIGTWQLFNGILSMSMAVSFSPIPIPIVISNAVITGTSITGTIEALPMMRDAKYPIGGPLDGNPSNTDPTNLNVQYISVDIQLDAAQ